MTAERFIPIRPFEVFGLTQPELDRWRISDARFQEILAAPDTRIHTVEVSSNNYGNFLFLTTSRGRGQSRTRMTFYGLGYHDYRERWILDEWFWYQANQHTGDQRDNIPFNDALAMIKERRQMLSRDAAGARQSEFGEMFETIADMTDDDAALAEMQDLGLL
jgi:hypothetical protein